ncbi:hypothetical protein D3P07_25270 [Paenibacillus sp. 1011MAR3C5]|uniref:hypothetical protein n=1 Tax=Paenibacillus sp. 1011MAR3C5 TaxID=1675787 RepID=UPI000E6BA202|nr:hypothetical protein [Paenibacillus sp. 1011MAR3C5]RJE83278.1 hypothetical protein D3P07_25270 [Paenibacillus sp. 1011MAR3C5]
MVWKSLAWIGKIVAAGLILSFLSIWTTGYIVTSYVESVLKQFELPVEVPPMAMSGVWGKLWGSDPLLASDIEPEQESGSANNGQEPAAKEVFGGIEEEPGAGSGQGGDPVDGVQEGTGQTGAEVEIDGAETAVTTDDIASAKDEMSEEDKSLLFELLMTKLPPESWLEISEYMEGGLTEQELTSVQQIMAQHLDKSEYEQMMEILKKY